MTPSGPVAKKVLTRRANHLHIFNIARIEPAPGNWFAGFLMQRDTATRKHNSAERADLGDRSKRIGD
jgi:hypothetical protein